ncbi:MAG: hypothetical protein WC869_11845 [Phycisphaerae bacterium]|jgi:hypothetical protein
MTPLQIETLKLIGDGKVHMHNAGTAAWRTFGASGSVVGRLVSQGFAKWPKGVIGEQTCELTDAGRSAIAKAEGK